MCALIVLAGFPASGKSAVGQALSEKGSLQWKDLDELIEEKANRTISEIIRVEGERYFRELEKKELLNLLSGFNGVLSVGGGALLDDESRKMLAQKASTIQLLVGSKCATARIEADERQAREEGSAGKRPLFASDAKLSEQVEELLASRQEHYASLPAALSIWTDWTSPEDVAAIILRELSAEGFAGNDCCGEPPAEIVLANFSKPEEGSEIWIVDGILNSIGAHLKLRCPKAGKVALISDEQVYSHWGEGLAKAVEVAGFEISCFELPTGESSKNLGEVERICAGMLEAGMTRSDLVIGLGGGVVGDVAGLVASLYMRGVSLVHLPTTLVAQVDSAIGGKTGVNLPAGKNMLGTFKPAESVISDPTFLRTLSDREFLAGMAEVVKYGFIYSSDFLTFVEENVAGIIAREAKPLREIVSLSSRIKVDVVASDLHDLLGRRAILNFGHTVGHAIEKLGGYGDLLHGEAVSIGMVQALELGFKLGVGQKEFVERARALLQQFSLPTEVPEKLLKGSDKFLEAAGISERTEEVFRTDFFNEAFVNKMEVAFVNKKNDFYSRWSRAIKTDKKRALSKIHFILIPELGCAKVREVGVSEIVSSIAMAAC